LQANAGGGRTAFARAAGRAPAVARALSRRASDRCCCRLLCRGQRTAGEEASRGVLDHREADLLLKSLICATLPEPKTSHRWLSWAFSSEVRGAPLACFLICALQTATSAAPPPDGIAELGVVVVELLLVEELLGVELVLVVVVLVVVVLVVVVLVAALEEVLLEVVAAALVVLALLVALLVAVVVVLGLLPPQAATSAPLTTAPTSSRYSLRVIVHPSD